MTTIGGASDSPSRRAIIALCHAEHVHRPAAGAWLGRRPFALCPITEGALVRYSVRLGEAPAIAQAVVQGLRSLPQGEWWADDVSYATIDTASIRGHADVTDAYLVALARHHGGRLATFDRRLAEQHPDAVTLVPTGDA